MTAAVGRQTSSTLTKAILYVVCLGLALRIGVSFWNGLWGPSLGAGLDALSFHKRAESFAIGETDFVFQIGWLYAYALGLLYKVTGPYVLVGSLASCLAWLASVVALKFALDRLEITHVVQLCALAAYSLLPSAIGYTGVTLREPFQLLAMNLMVLAAVGLVLDRSLSLSLAFVTAGTFGGLLHGAIVLVGIIAAVPLVFWLILAGVRKGDAARALVAAIPLIVFVGYSGMLFGYFSYGAVSGGDLVSATEAQREVLATIPARTDYHLYAAPPAAEGTVMPIVVGLFQYMFEPMPWRIQTVFDAVVAAENVLRLMLLLLSLRSVVETKGVQRGLIVYLLLIYACLEGLWSLGTSNWGTAVRHHIPAMGILLVCAAAGFQKQRQAGSLAA